MTTDTTTEYSLAELTQILSALGGKKRHPCTKKAAIKATNMIAETLGIDPDEVFIAAAALLGGQDPEEWRASLVGEASAEAEVQAEAEAQVETSWDNRMSPAALGEEALRAEDETRAKQADADHITVDICDEPVAGPEAEAEPEAQEPDEPAQEDDPVDLHSEEFAETEFAKENEASWPSGRKTRENSKQARAIAMLRRPEGATVEQIGAEFGWQKHTVRAFVSATLGKKLGLNITSGKIDGKRTYRIED